MVFPEANSLVVPEGSAKYFLDFDGEADLDLSHFTVACKLLNHSAFKPKTNNLQESRRRITVTVMFILINVVDLGHERFIVLYWGCTTTSCPFQRSGGATVTFARFQGISFNLSRLELKLRVL